mmetsp:Transcript_12821/g.31285  ORF Transcript_12821/g.31285 Transcript_12821/m.31285 type:complete len:301 (-) Transcript_12821:391-1293(-)
MSPLPIKRQPSSLLCVLCRLLLYDKISTSTTSSSLFGHEASLRPQRPRLQLRQRLPRRQSLIQRPVHRIAYRHLHPQPLAQHPNALRRRHSLRDGIRAAANLLQGHPPRQFAPHAKIPTQARRAREHEISHPGQARHRPSVRSARHREARQLGEAPTHQRRARVVAEFEPVQRPGRDGEDVLDRAGDFYAGDVVGHVRAEGGAVGDVPRHALGDVGRYGRDDDVRGLSVHDLLGEGRSGEDGEVSVILPGQFAHHHLVRGLGCPHLDSLGAYHYGTSHGNVREVPLEEGAEELRGYDEQD